MKFQKPSEGLRELLEEKLEGAGSIRKKMFGQWAFFLNGHMLAGVFQDDIFLRFSREQKEEIMAQYDEVDHFAPREGQVMKEYAIIPESVYNDDELFEDFIRESIYFVSGLPPKKK